MTGSLNEETYRWSYYHKGPVIFCQNNSGSDDQPEAMCASEETAMVFCRILNASRQPENIL